MSNRLETEYPAMGGGYGSASGYKCEGTLCIKVEVHRRNNCRKGEECNACYEHDLKES